MLTYEELKNKLEYFPETGVFYRKLATSSRVKIGDTAGSKRRDGYIHISLGNVKYSAHRLAWFYMTGSWPKKIIDHRNRVKSDNCWRNLREASFSQNQQNRTSASKSGVKGVYFKPWGKYQVQLNEKGERKCFGTFSDFTEACKVSFREQERVHAEFMYCKEGAV